MKALSIDGNDFYWLVGLLEGEGSFTKGAPSAPNSPRINVQMTDEDVIARIAIMFGRKYNRYVSKNPKHKPTYVVRCTGLKAVNLMVMIQPYMSIRRQGQIQTALDSYDPSFRDKVFAMKLKLSEDQVKPIAEAINNKSLSLRKAALNLGVNHETLRSRLKSLGLYGVKGDMDNRLSV